MHIAYTVLRRLRYANKIHLIKKIIKFSLTQTDYIYHFICLSLCLHMISSALYFHYDAFYDRPERSRSCYLRVKCVRIHGWCHAGDTLHDNMTHFMTTCPLPGTECHVKNNLSIYIHTLPLYLLYLAIYIFRRNS